MANQKVSDLPSLNGADVDAADLLYIIDSSAGSAGSKKITVGQYQVAPVSGGTANGVMYLDGSKVPTAGSGLVFDGNNLGLGVTPGYAYPGWSVMQISRDMTLLSSSGGSVYAGMAVNAYPDLSASPSSATWRYKLTGSLASKYEQTSGIHQWFTAGTGTAGNAITFTQAMTLTSGGDLLVGTTTTSGAGGITLLNNGSSGFSFVNNNNAAATGYVFASYRRSSTEIGSITQNGTTAILFNTTSDRRLKENISPAPSASNVIDAIEIVSHDWKSAPDEHVTYGVIAQDLALVAPQAVLQGDDGDEIEKTWGVDYSKLVPMLIKEIQSLRARVAALESA